MTDKYNLEYLERKLGPFDNNFTYPTKKVLGYNLIYIETQTKKELEEVNNKIKQEMTPGYIWGYVINTNAIYVTRAFGENKLFIFNPSFNKKTDYVKSKKMALNNLSETNINKLFDQKAVFETFYKKLWNIRLCLAKEIKSKNAISDNKSLMSAQYIIDRIIFTYFLCERNLVTFNGKIPVSGKTLFLDTFCKMDKPWTYLSNLFFKQFAKKNSENLDIGSNTYVDAPYLNGGLFRPKIIEGISEEDYILECSKDKWKKIFEPFNKYSWILEDELPDHEGDYEGNLTPEIMGHIYEKFVISIEELDEVKLEELKISSKGDLEKGNKKIGAYYTPENITDYISRGTITPYIFEKLGIQNNIDFENFLVESDPETLKNALDILNDIKICDPAAGSGAFLIKAGEVLLDFKTRILLQLGESSIDRYIYKREIIIKNLYGVDIQEGAIEICKLRLWLWLMSSSKEDKIIEPLPNIEYNFRVGNTLIGWLNENIIQSGLHNPLNDTVKGIFKGLMAFADEDDEEPIKRAEDYLKGFKLNEYIDSYYILYKLYRKSHGKKAENLRDIIEIIRSSIYDSIDPAFRDHLNEMIKPKFKKDNPPISKKDYNEFNVFHWRVDFGHIIKNGGFDIIIGNPPYVRADTDNERYQRQRKWLKKLKMYKTLYEKWDLFIPFIERGLNLLINDGFFSFIISNSYNTSKFADKSKKHVDDEYHIEKIDFFKNIIVFKGVGVESVIITIQNSKKQEKSKRILHTDSFENTKELEPSNNIDSMFRIAKTIDFDSKFDKTELLGDICYLSKGMVLNSDEKNSKDEFKKDDLISDTKTEFNTRPYIEAKNFKRYRINQIRYLEWDTERCPSKISRKTFPELYLPQKIIGGRTTGCIFDDKKLVCNESAYIFVLFDSICEVSNRSIKTAIKKWTDKSREELDEISRHFTLKYIIAILNSKFAIFYLNTIRRHRIEYYFYPDDFRKMPIKRIPLKEQNKYATMVDKIGDLNNLLVNEITSFKNFLNSEFDLENYSQKIESYYDMSFDNFLEELKNKKVDIDSNKDLIQSKYIKSIEILTPLLEEIKKTDNHIDKMIYDLYELTDEEINLIEMILN